MQLERILQSQGFGTRKECRYLIRAGYVTVRGNDAENPFEEFSTETPLPFTVGEVESCFHENAYLVLNKPQNTECSQKPKHHPSVYSLLPDYIRDRGVQTVGRLDEDTTGLLIFTDDGSFIHTLTSPKKKVNKVYEVTLKHPHTPELLEAMLSGVLLHDDPDPVEAVACVAVDSHTIHLTLREGRYHQVKRMVGAAGNRVDCLSRIQIGSYVLPENLAAGEWAWLTAEDLLRLQRNPELSESVK
jgi:16S rRNA pseudouridine516 synthase